MEDLLLSLGDNIVYTIPATVLLNVSNQKSS